MPLTDDEFESMLLSRGGFKRPTLRQIGRPCGLCELEIEPKDWIRVLPDSWEPHKTTRLGHYACINYLANEITRTTGIGVTLS